MERSRGTYWGPSEDVVSERLIAQRMRNRVMEAMRGLADWQAEIQTFDAADYFEDFFDFVPYEAPHSNPTLNPQEWQAVEAVHAMMAQACDETRSDVEGTELIATGWPQRIGLVAQEAWELMSKRGRFSETAEETEPSMGEI